MCVAEYYSKISGKHKKKKKHKNNTSHKMMYLYNRISLKLLIHYLDMLTTDHCITKKRHKNSPILVPRAKKNVGLWGREGSRSLSPCQPRSQGCLSGENPGNKIVFLLQHRFSSFSSPKPNVFLSRRCEGDENATT